MSRFRTAFEGTGCPSQMDQVENHPCLNIQFIVLIQARVFALLLMTTFDWFVLQALCPHYPFVVEFGGLICHLT